MTALLSPSAKQQFFDDAGNPAAGYKLYTYAANTTTPQATYTNRAGTVANANPIVLDARGEATVYLTPGVVYDYVLKTAADVDVWTREDVSAQAGEADAVNFLQAGTGAVSRTVQDKLRDIVSVKDFGAVGDYNGTTGTDDTAAFQAFLTYIAANKVSGYVPGGGYLITNKLTAQGNISILGAGRNKSRLHWPVTSTDSTSGLWLTTQLSSGFDSQVQVRGIGLFTKAVSLGTALKVTGDTAAASDRVTARLLIHDFQARGEVNPTSDGWDCGIWMDGLQAASLMEVFVNGMVGSGGEPNYNSTYGIRYDNTVGLSPHPGKIDCWNVNAGYAKTGFYCYDFEGLTIVGGNFNGNTGIYAGGPANFPGVFIHNAHANCSDSCITIDGLAEALVTNNELYKELGTNTGKGVWLKGGATFSRVTGNVFTNAGPTLHEMYAVLIEASDDNTVEGNTFRAVNTPGGGGIAVWISSGSRNVVGVNTYGSTVETRLVDSGTATVRADGYPSSGTYAPTGTGVLNVASVTMDPCQWLRVGNVVTLSGSLAVTPTAASASTQVEFPLPVASDFTAVSDLAGTGASFTSGVPAARLYANDTNNTVIFRFFSSGTAAVGFSFTATYRVI